MDEVLLVVLVEESELPVKLGKEDLVDKVEYKFLLEVFPFMVIFLVEIMQTLQQD